MKSFIRGACTIAAILLGFATKTAAIEGLQVSLQCSNVILSWPCLPDGSEVFIVQYRPTLLPDSPWQTLEQNLYAVYGTNMMYYVHSNVVLNPNCGNSGSGMSMVSQAMVVAGPQLSEPMAKLADGSSAALPVAIFPPYFEFTNYLILDPNSGEWLSGDGYFAPPPIAMMQENMMQLDAPDGAGSGGGGSAPSPDIGFYRVVRVGPHMVGVTNGMTLSGVLHIPVELGAPTGQVVTVTITENGSPVTEDSIHVSPFESTVPLITLDTAKMTNGFHQIAALARWEIAGGTNENTGGFFEADCPAISIVVSNEISYPNWMTRFGELGNTLLISAQSAHTNTDWMIDIYGANAGYIGTFAGHTSDGSIYGWWDLTGPPPNYIPYTNEPWFQFKISTPYVDPPTPKSYKITDPWPSPGGWVAVAQHAFDNIPDHETLYEEIDGFITGAQASGLTVRPNPQDGHAFPLHYSDPNTPSDWNTFRQALYHPLSRNLIYFGHGGPNGLGFAQGNTNLSIIASEIQTNLHTIPAGQTNRHGYRMVIVDGCSTAAGTLPESFGIIHKENVPGIDYANASLRPSAYAGWTADKWVGFLNGAAVNYDHINFIIHMQYEMAANGSGIKAAIDAAALYPDVHQINTSQLKVFGLWSLNFWAFNN
jgi:hypothetical protein